MPEARMGIDLHNTVMDLLICLDGIPQNHTDARKDGSRRSRLNAEPLYPGHFAYEASSYSVDQ
jgi:hypothetical protein